MVAAPLLLAPFLVRFFVMTILHHLLDHFRNRSLLFVPDYRQGLFLGAEFDFYVFCGNEMPNTSRFKLDYAYLTRSFTPKYTIFKGSRPSSSVSLSGRLALTREPIKGPLLCHHPNKESASFSLARFFLTHWHMCVKKVPSPISSRHRHRGLSTSR